MSGNYPDGLTQDMFDKAWEYLSAEDEPCSDCGAPSDEPCKANCGCAFCTGY